MLWEVTKTGDITFTRSVYFVFCFGPCMRVKILDSGNTPSGNLKFPAFFLMLLLFCFGFLSLFFFRLFFSGFLHLKNKVETSRHLVSREDWVPLHAKQNGGRQRGRNSWGKTTSCGELQRRRRGRRS